MHPRNIVKTISTTYEMKTYQPDIINRSQIKIEQILTPIPVMSVLSGPKGNVQKPGQLIIFARNACPAELLTFSRVRLGSWLRNNSKIVRMDPTSVRSEQVNSVGPGAARGMDEIGAAAAKTARNRRTIVHFRRKQTTRKKRSMVQD